jgi:hypothetical protein
MDGDCLAKHKAGRELLGPGAKGLSLLWAVDPVQTDSLWSAIMHSVDGVTVKDTDDLAGEF